MLAMIAGREPLGRLVDQKKPARLDDGAGDRQHLLLSAGQHARGQRLEFLQRGKQAENPSQPRLVDRAGARRQQQISRAP